MNVQRERLTGLCQELKSFAAGPSALPGESYRLKEKRKA
jgi:hypothetical protein